MLILWNSVKDFLFALISKYLLMTSNKTLTKRLLLLVRIIGNKTHLQKMKLDRQAKKNRFWSACQKNCFQLELFCVYHMTLKFCQMSKYLVFSYFHDTKMLVFFSQPYPQQFILFLGPQLHWSLQATIKSYLVVIARKSNNLRFLF